MQADAGEVTGNVRNERLAVMSGTDEEIVENFLPPAARARQTQRPAAVALPMRLLDARIEHDMGPDIEAVRVALEISEHLLVGRKIRILGRHREIVELRQWLRRDDMRRFVDAHPTRVLVELPIAPDAVALVVTEDVAEPDGKEVLDRGEPARSGAD